MRSIQFEVSIAGAEPEGPTRALTVSGPAPGTGAPRRRDYHLPDATHPSWLDFFEALARDFGTRPPHSRQPPEPASATTPFQPLLTQALSPDILYGYGDPAILRVEDGHTEARTASFHLIATSNDAPRIFPILHSPDLKDWRLQGFAFEPGHAPAWAAPIGPRGDPGTGQGGEYWAPELHQLNNRFLLCFAAREHDGSFSIGLATSPTPAGPFRPEPEPILRGNVIDAHILTASDGSVFLFWKDDTNDVWPGRLAQLLHDHPHLAAELFPREEDHRTAAFAQALWPWTRTLAPMERFFVLQGLIEAAIADFPILRGRLADLAGQHPGLAELLRLMRTPIHGQRLDPHSLTLLGEPKLVLQNDLPWEGHLVEGVWVAEHEGRFHMLYAGNDFSTPRYGIGSAVADHPLGPYRKAAEPFLRSTPEWSGPGHPSVAEGPDGGPWLFLHAFFPNRSGYKEFRALLALPIAFGPQGIEVRR